jgi:hypothetical protein
VTFALALVATATTMVITGPSAQAWTGWTQVPGAGTTVDSPATAGDGIVQYMAVRGTNNGIFIQRYAATWSGWSEIPGNGRTLSAPAIETLDDVYVVVRGTDDRIYMNTMIGSRWTGWVLVPGGMTTDSAPAIAIGPGGLQLVVRNANRHIYYNRMDVDNWTWRGWSEIPGGGITLSAPTVTVVNNGIAVFVRGTNNGIFLNTLSADLSHWTGWGELPGNGRTLAGPSATEGFIEFIPTNTHVVVRGTDNLVYINSRNDISGAWGGWRVVPGGRTTQSAPAARVLSGQYAYIYIRGTDNRIYENYDHG